MFPMRAVPENFMSHRFHISFAVLCILPLGMLFAAPLKLDMTPARSGEWGFRPASDTTIQVTPPAFSWRPQKGAVTYEVECSRVEDMQVVGYRASGIEFSVHCPPEVFEEGAWFWRFRYRDQDGAASPWSPSMPFRIAAGSNRMPLPEKAELLARIPDSHPRLFVRPEQMAELSRLAQGKLKPAYDGLVKTCEKLLENPPSTKEPPTYPEGMKRKSDPWLKIWWGNRVIATKALGGAATLAFTRQLGGKEEYGQLAKRILMDCAEWDPKGATGYRYNDEAGMPYNYYFSRTYTFVHDLLSQEERAKCQAVMAVRGEEMYRHLHPRHLWRPYASHSNRAWHFLGEIGVAFNGEIPEAGQWAWFAANVFACVYPVWCDEDGGWHEGSAYWSSYIGRFTWWADVMRAAMGLNAYDMPYFSQVGYYAMYLQPPHTQAGGFGDQTPPRKASHNRGIMSVLAAQAGNPHWQWYVNELGGTTSGSGYIGFVREGLPQVAPKAPVDLPSSRCFRGTGIAILNSNLLDGRENVEVVLKASPFGTQSHGYESQNSFLLYAFGRKLFIRSGRRDTYGSKHHRNWMWNTKSTNCVTVNGAGQQGHSSSAVGEISLFETSPAFDYVVGEAAPAYKGLLKRFTRRILFIKPEAIVIHDTLEAPQPSSFEWLLHARREMTVTSQHDIRLENGAASCRTNFLWPPDLAVTQTDQFDPPPRPRVKLTEYHLTAQTSMKNAECEFVTVIRPHRTGTELRGSASLQKLEGGFALTIPTASGRIARVLLNASPGTLLAFGGLATSGTVAVVEATVEGVETRRYVCK